MTEEQSRLFLTAPQGIVYKDSDFGKALGFTSDLFSGYLWHDRGVIWISHIHSLNPGKGNLKKLFDTIEENGFAIIVPTPFARMQHICEQRGMVMSLVNAQQGGIIKCMVRPMPQPPQPSETLTQ